jgi:hypothetical protein
MCIIHDEAFTVQDLIDMLNTLSVEDKKLPIVIIDYRGHYISPTGTWKDYFYLTDNKPILVLYGNTEGVV